MSDTNENTPLPGTSQTLPIALNAISDATEPHTIDPSSLTPYEKKLYDFLYSQGWTHTQCCNTAQVQCLHEQCEMELPEHFPAPRGNAEQQDLQMQLRLNEEMNRRRAIGERMYSSTGTMDREIDEGRRA
ncbi:uncharacterized protein AKAW2_60388A [Aspergillus luchuensis]|uniref:Uncharacterized protein n=1 Tax=Aspergillus kawachii TaxID=1069201 RepID=A0A7R8A0Y1_ASPKA|nr:uncharacterized protein AKAW2_60388A [Aspergillus luchuensis]BCS02124.1 hypothetical protein AKAW2_60388A [Aspergillus luchuensis]BCS13812.1 hypothetical protein ALUC_60368A [Aspergillus luchuensis]